MKNILKSLLHLLSHTKMGKLLPIIILSGLMATASAAVFTNYYASTTATVATPDIQLVAGGDSVASVSGTKDTATLSITLYPADTTFSIVPSKYYTDALQIKNAGSGAHTIQKITISSITDADSQLGKITVYYTSAITATPETASIGSYEITSTTGGDVFSGTQAIAASATQYIELVGYAKSGATAAKTITFTITIQWA